MSRDGRRRSVPSPRGVHGRRRLVDWWGGDWDEEGTTSKRRRQTVEISKAAQARVAAEKDAERKKRNEAERVAEATARAEADRCYVCDAPVGLGQILREKLVCSPTCLIAEQLGEISYELMRLANKARGDQE